MADNDGLRWLGDLDQAEVVKEDFAAQGQGKYTVNGLNPHDDDWLEKASQQVHAAHGDDYVQLDRGLLTVNQLNWLLKEVYGELTYCDDNHQLMWYNRQYDDPNQMMGRRRPEQVGDNMDDVHPDVGNVRKYAKQVWYGLRTKTDGRDEVWTPVSKGHGEPIMHYNRYKRIEDEAGNFRGITEWVVDLKPLAEYYCRTNGLKMVPDEQAQRPDWVETPADVKRNQAPEEPDATGHPSN